MRYFVYLFIILSVSFSFAQEAMNPTVEEISICTAVENRMPVGADTVFNSDVGTVFCFTKVTGAAADSSISHVWYFNDQEASRVKLNVGADAWRTWSSKTIVDEYVGNWRVDVESASGNVLTSKSFEIKAVKSQ